jgi:serine/threonine kinase PknH
MSDPEPDSRADSQFGPSGLSRLLSRGGISEVYEAENAGKEWIAALKLLPQAISQDMRGGQGAACRPMSVSLPGEHR